VSSVVKKHANTKSGKTTWYWFRLVFLFGALAVAVYFLTAPLMLDILWKRSWELNVKSKSYEKTCSWRFYAPARAAITRDWFGRDFYDGYCYKVCGMRLLMPMDVAQDKMKDVNP